MTMPTRRQRRGGAATPPRRNAAAPLLARCLVLLCAAGSAQELRSPSGCHVPALSSGYDGDDAPAAGVVATTRTETAQGVVFSASNSGPADVYVSALSVALDPASRLAFDYDVRSADGPYLERAAGGGGGVGASLLGAPLLEDGRGNWTLVARREGATRGELASDGDGGSFLPFFFDEGEGGGDGIATTVVLPAGGTASFYVNFTANVATVRRTPGGAGQGSPLEGEEEDGAAAAAGGYEGLRMNVGRTVSRAVRTSTRSISPASCLSLLYSFPNQVTLWLDPVDDLGPNLFDIFYRPARFIGKLWTEIDTCSPTASPITGAPSVRALFSFWHDIHDAGEWLIASALIY